MSLVGGRVLVWLACACSAVSFTGIPKVFGASQQQYGDVTTEFAKYLGGIENVSLGRSSSFSDEGLLSEVETNFDNERIPHNDGYVNLSEIMDVPEYEERLTQFSLQTPEKRLGLKSLIAGLLLMGIFAGFRYYYRASDFVISGELVEGRRAVEVRRKLELGIVVSSAIIISGLMQLWVSKKHKSAPHGSLQVPIAKRHMIVSVLMALVTLILMLNASYIGSNPRLRNPMQKHLVDSLLVSSASFGVMGLLLFGRYIMGQIRTLGKLYRLGTRMNKMAKKLEDLKQEGSQGDATKATGKPSKDEIGKMVSMLLSGNETRKLVLEEISKLIDFEDEVSRPVKESKRPIISAENEGVSARLENTNPIIPETKDYSAESDGNSTVAEAAIEQVVESESQPEFTDQEELPSLLSKDVYSSSFDDVMPRIVLHVLKALNAVPRIEEEELNAKSQPHQR